LTSPAPTISPARVGAFLAVAAAALAQPAAVAGAGPAPTSVTATPSLSPKFDPAISDYVSHCPAKKPLRLSVSTAPGDTVAVDGKKARAGRFSAPVRLKANQGTRFVLRTHGRSSTFYVRCIPADFFAWKATRYGPTQAQWYLMTPIGPASSRYVGISDSNGVPVWWTRTPHPPFNASALRDGTLAWCRYLGGRFAVAPIERYEIHRLDGRLVRTLRLVGTPTDLHELQQLPNGNFLLGGYKARTGVDLRAYGGAADSKVYDAYVQEITPSGRKVWDWDSKDHIGLSETADWWPALIQEQRQSPARSRYYDLVHINSIEPDGDSLILSFRYLDAIYKINRSTGAVEWKIGGTHRPESLNIVGDPTYGGATFGGQHDARVLPDGTVTVFDNGTARERPPRAVRYRVDETARTATLLEQITDPEANRSGYAGSARKLPGGNWVVSWGGTTLVTEASPSGQPLLRLSLLRSHYSYRAFPIPFGRLSAGALRKAMDKMNPRGRHH